MSVAKAVQDKRYRQALEMQALKIATQIDNLEDEKNLANLSRELRLLLIALGIDEGQESTDRVPKLADSVASKLKDE